VISKPPNNLGLVGCWSFEDGRGNTATDFSGNGNTGTLTNMENSDWVTGKRGKALDFDGGSSSEYATTGSFSQFSGGKVTASAWVKKAANSQNGFIVSKSPVNTNWQLFLQGTALYWGAVSPQLSCGFGDQYLDVWTHVVGVQDGTTGQIYINGVQCASGTIGAFTESSSAILIGKHSANNYYFSGSIDEFRIYSRALSATEVLQLYNMSQ